MGRKNSEDVTTLCVNDYGFYGGWVDEHGKPVKKTPMTNPDSYDGYVTYRAGKNSEVNETAYSDRLRQEDREKDERLKKKHFGTASDYTLGGDPKKVEAYLCDFLGRPVKIIFIMQYCYPSGYPYWRFDVKFLDKK